MAHALAGGIEQRDVVDDAEEFGQLVVGGTAAQAVIVRQLAKVGGVAGGTVHGAHGIFVAFLTI
jgi:hypothetical protein